MEKFDENKHICPHCGYDNNTPHNPVYITPGTVLHDRYLVGILLEYNGEGATYTGHDISTGCKVTLREYMPINLCTRVRNKATISVNYNNLAKYKAFMAEYTELNKSLARLRNNSNITPVLDMFAENNTTYTVFEHIEGMKMLDYLKENAGELSWEQVSKLFPQLFTTIGILHNSGIIHRAISPDTIYITDRGELKLSGFCVSAVRTADAGLEYELFKGYAAPEQYSASSSSRQGSWTDVYGVCALIYRALTGCMPVDSVSRLKHDDLCEPSRLNNQIPQHVSRVIMEGMNLSGRDRIQTITELVTRLFEQPAPSKPLVNVNAVSHEKYPENTSSYNTNYYNVNNNNTSINPNNYNNNNYAPPQYDQGYQPPPMNYPPPQPQPAPERYSYEQNNSAMPEQNDYDDYRYEKVNTVDRIKVPIIIGILFLAILLIIAVFVINAVAPGAANVSSSSSLKLPSSSVEDNIVTSETEAATETTTLKADTEMPNFVGKFYEFTQDKYKDYFTFEAIYDYNNDYEADMIFEQNIEPGTQVVQGSLVKVKVSKGIEGANIPEYSGLTVSQYENRLKEAGITNYSLVASNSGWGTPNTVTLLQIDGKNVNAGSYFSNKEEKKLVVYYTPADAVVQQPATEAPYVQPTEAYVEPATEAPTAPPATEAPATEAPATEAPQTEAPATEAPQTEAPAEQ